LTHTIHYLGAVFLIGFLSYMTLDYFLSGRREYRLTTSAYVRISLFWGILLTGIFRVPKNLPDVSFSPGFTLFFDLAHLGFVMLYLLSALVLLFLRSGWTTRTHA
jgi:hypothetical protein